MLIPQELQLSRREFESRFPLAGESNAGCFLFFMHFSCRKFFVYLLRVL